MESLTSATSPVDEASDPFAQLGLDDALCRGVQALGFSDPTPVQADAIPLVLAGKDVVASAQTGTGKTAAFALPILQRLETTTDKGPHALIVTPTRELAQQIYEVCSQVGKEVNKTAALVIGGARLKPQLRALSRGADILVATPGRLLDLMEHHSLRLKKVQILVLDEADRMLDMGFLPSVKQIVQACPKKRQTLLFSATIPPKLASLIDTMMSDPVRVEISHIGETAETVEEALMPVVQGQKIELLEALIKDKNYGRVLVFCRTKQRVDSVFEALKRSGLSVGVMHADRHQKARERALDRFRKGKTQVLVATDVMSRGIDVVGIDAVVNFDVPLDPEDYIHRIGRTGRAGVAGHAYTFVAPDEVSALRAIEYFTQTLIPVVDLEGFAYREGRIVPNSRRSAIKPKRTMFSGSKSRARSLMRGRYGRHT